MASSLRELNLDPFGQQPQRIPIYRDEPEFVDRVRNNQNYPVINNPDGSVSTHRMAAESDANGNWYVFPTIQMQDGELVEYYDSRDAMDAAFKTGNILRAPDKQSALNYAEGAYKRDTGLGDRPVSTLRGLQELSPSDPLYIHQDPMPAGADIMTQQEAISELTQREESARVAGTVSPFESSWNPTNPNFRATAQNAISNMLGGSNISSNPNYLQGRIANTLSGLVDFIPAVGDAVGVGDTMTSYRQGDMLGTGINALATGVGVLPLVGGPASKAVRAGGNRARSALRGLEMNPEARMARADEQGLTKTLYHGTHADIEEFDPNMVDIGTHLGTSEQANKRLKDVYRSRNGLSTFVGGDEVASGANVMPVRANLGKSLEMNDVGMWSDSEKVISELEDMPEFRGKFDDAWEELGVKDSYGDSQDWINSTENREMLDEINAEIRRQGYDSIRYANQVENKYGNLAGTRPEVATRKKTLSDELKAIDLSRRPATREAPTIEDVKINPNAVEEWIKESNVKASYSPQQEQRMIQINQELKSLDELNKDDIYSYIILEPKNIRSTNAEFDPTKADSSDLLSSISPTQSSLRNIA